MSEPTVKFRRLHQGYGLPLPAYATARAAGLDLAACDCLAPRLVGGDWLLSPGARVQVHTGFEIELQPGYEAQVRPRSGLARTHGVTVLNSPGTIDADYRGELCVLLINHGNVPFVFGRGDRIAQLVIAPVSRARIVETEVLDETERGEGGFGSTGT